MLIATTVLALALLVSLAFNLHLVGQLGQQRKLTFVIIGRALHALSIRGVNKRRAVDLICHELRDVIRRKET